MITLTSSRLRIDLSEPGECPNDGYRFDRAGFITEVVLDGDRRFCASEPRNLSHPTSGGRGLCSEIKTDISVETGTGEAYPKFGVGIVPKNGDEPYSFFGTYRGVRFFPVRITHSKDTATFETEPVPCFGYALKGKTTVTVVDNELTVLREMTAVGDKPIEVVEYNHNFLSIDGMAVTPDYRIELPMLRDFGDEPLLDRDGNPCNLIGCGHGLTFKRPDPAVSVASLDLTGMARTVPFAWRLVHEGAKAYVEGTDHFVPTRVVVWACDHIISPEIFHTVVVQPGETARWKRSWRFGTL